MLTTARSNRVYDHRLKVLIRDTGDIRLATDKRVPLSTARGWLRQPRQEVVTLDIFERQEQELLSEVMALRRHNRTLLAVLRLLLVLLRVSGFTLAHCRVRDGDKKALLRAIERARGALVGVFQKWGIQGGTSWVLEKRRRGAEEGEAACRAQMS